MPKVTAARGKNVLSMEMQTNKNSMKGAFLQMKKKTKMNSNMFKTRMINNKARF